jgi:hypothetical protein
MLAVARSNYLRYLFALICTCTHFPILHAQSTESEINARLINQPLYLRGCWRDDTLHFDSDGHLKDHSLAVTFTLCGFELQNVQLKPDKVILKGRRIGLELKDYKQLRVPINVGKPTQPKDETIHLEILVSSTGNYGPALDAIFINGLAQFLPSMPSYWKPYALKNFASIDNTSTPPTAPTTSDGQPPAPKPARIGGGINPPRLLSSKSQNSMKWRADSTTAERCS